MHNSCRYLLLLCWVFLFSGCSSDEIKNEPMELESFEETVEIEEIWSESVGDGTSEQYLSYAPFIHGEAIYAASFDGVVMAMDRLTGKVHWEIETEDPVSGALGGDGNNLYYMTYHGELVALSIHSGTELWRNQLSSEGLSAPQSNGRLVVANTIDGNVYAFDITTGDKAWQYSATQPVLSIRGDARAQWGDDQLVLGFADGKVRSFSGGDGQPLWQYDATLQKGRTELERLVDLDGQPLIYEGRVYIIAYQGKVASLDLQTGRELWSKTRSSYRGLSQDYSHLYLTTDQDEVHALDLSNGSPAWTNKSLKFRSLTSPTPFGEYLAVGDFEGYVHFLSQVSGDLAARLHLDSDGIRSSMLVHDDILYVYTNSGDLSALKVAP